MGTNMVTALGSHGRRDCLRFLPEQLTIIEDESSALHDGRPSTVSEAFVANIAEEGVLTPILVRYAGRKGDKPIIEVVDGRRRVRAVMLINAERAKRKLDPIYVQAVTAQGDDADLFRMVVELNEQRAETPIPIKAKQAQKMLQQGQPMQVVMRTFGVSRATISAWQALNGSADAVQRACEKGEISLEVAVELSKLENHDEQRAALTKMREEGTLRGRAATTRAREIKVGKAESGDRTGAFRMRPRRFFSTAVKGLREQESAEARELAHLLDFVSGNDAALGKLSSETRALLKPYTQPPEKKKASEKKTKSKK